MKGFIIFLVAVWSFIIMCPLSLLYAIWRNKLNWTGYAISIDQSINAIAGELLNTLFLKEKHLFVFGDMDKTISHNLGQNKKQGNLNSFGLLVCNLLHWLDKNHVERSFEDNV